MNKYEIAKCRNCDSELAYREEMIYFAVKKLNKDGSIPKKLIFNVNTGTEHKHLICNACGELYDYTLDEKGRVVEVEVV